METKTATETTPEPAAKPTETKATPPAEPTAKPTEDTAMKTTAEAKSETTEAEKRKKPEEESDDKDMSEGVKKLTKLVEEHSDVKALLQELSEKNKTNERIAEVYRKQVRQSHETKQGTGTRLVSLPWFRLPNSLPRVSAWPWVCPRARPSLSVDLASRFSLRRNILKCWNP